MILCRYRRAANIFPEQNTYSLFYYRNGTFHNDEWSCSVSAEYFRKYLNAQIQETFLVTYIKDTINRFVQTGIVSNGKSTGRLLGSEEVVQDYTYYLC
jgi:hypothetical protein